MADDGNADAQQQEKTFTQAEVEAAKAAVDAKNRELLAELRKVKDQLKPFDGLDPERARKALEAAGTAEAERQRQAGDWEAREKTLRDGFRSEHDKVVTPLQQRLAAMESQLFEATAVREATEAITGARGNPHLLLPVLRSELVKVEVNGAEVTGVRGPDGKPRYHPTSGALVSLAERVTELRADSRYAGAFEGSPGNGSGTTPSGGGGAVSKISDLKTDKDRVDYIAKHGLEAYEKLVWASATPART